MDSDSENIIDGVVARVSSLAVSEGGNPSPFFDGYRAIMHYDGRPDDEYHGVKVSPHDDAVFPGTTETCTIKFFYPEYHKNAAVVGATFQLMDGLKVRAVGRIESIGR